VSTKKQSQEHVEASVEQEEVLVSHEEDVETTEQPIEEEVVDQENARYEELSKKLEETEQKVLRVQADYDNFRRRTLKEKEELAKYASAKLVENILPSVDNFERAIQASSLNKDFDALSKGVDMIFRQLMTTMENEGLAVIKAVGEPFNPEYHQAIMQVESDEYEEGIVVEEIQKGYLLKDKVIRPAMVKVSG